MLDVVFVMLDVVFVISLLVFVISFLVLFIKVCHAEKILSNVLNKKLNKSFQN